MRKKLRKKPTIPIHGASYLIAFDFNFHYKPTPFLLSHYSVILLLQMRDVI